MCQANISAKKKFTITSLLWVEITLEIIPMLNVFPATGAQDILKQIFFSIIVFQH